MKVLVPNTVTHEWDPALVRSMIRVEAHGVIATLVDRDGSLSISVDPINSDWITRLATDEVSVTDTQARLTVRGRREADRDVVMMARQEVEKTRDLLVSRRMVDPIGDSEQALAELSMALRELELVG